jgi:glycosyltransferase involved in cell wall biosynthesis
MNVLQINSVCGTGSTGRIVAELHSILLSQNHTSAIAYGRATGKNNIQAIRIGGNFGNYIHVACTRLLDIHGFSSINATNKFLSKIKSLNPDLIHLHNIHGYYLHVGLLFDYLRQARKPVVWTLHDCWSFTGHCTHFDFSGCNKWIYGCYDCALTAEYPKSFFRDNSRCNYQRKKKFFSGIDNLTIVTPSTWLGGLVRNSFLQDYPVKVINNGIDLSVFKPAKGDFRKRYELKDKFVILGVASPWSERKGLHYLFDLTKHLRCDEIIVLVGVSKKQAKHLPPAVIGIAKTNNIQELVEIYSTADVFINPTLEDTFPTTNLEAMACGLPIITFNSGGSAECLNEECGLVVERGNVEGLVEAIALVRKNGKESYSIKCQKRAHQHFDKDARFAEYIKLYESIIK